MPSERVTSDALSELVSSWTESTDPGTLIAPAVPMWWRIDCRDRNSLDAGAGDREGFNAANANVKSAAGGSCRDTIEDSCGGAAQGRTPSGRGATVSDSGAGYIAGVGTQRAPVKKFFSRGVAVVPSTETFDEAGPAFKGEAQTVRHVAWGPAINSGGRRRRPSKSATAGDAEGMVSEPVGAGMPVTQLTSQLSQSTNEGRVQRPLALDTGLRRPSSANDVSIELDPEAANARARARGSTRSSKGSIWARLRHAGKGQPAADGQPRGPHRWSLISPGGWVKEFMQMIFPRLSADAAMLAVEDGGKKRRRG